MSLSDSQFSWILGLLLAAAALTEYGVMTISLYESNVSAYATWVFVGTLTGAYLISQREIGGLTDWEVTAFAAGIGGYVGIKFIPEFQNIVTNNQPWSGAAMVLITMSAFYVLTNEDI